MSATVSRRSRARSRIRRLAPLLGLPAAVVTMAALAQPAAAEVKLTSVFAAPLDATPTNDPATNQRYQCRPEPAGRYEYLTFEPWDPTRDEDLGANFPGGPVSPTYRAPNVSNSDALLDPAYNALDTQAGGSGDLCFGFTLTPNMQPEIVRQGTQTSGKRTQPPTGDPIPVDPDTPVAMTGGSAGDPIDNDDMKRVVVTMPSGFAGRPDALPKCPTADFAADKMRMVPASCSPAIVGTAYVRLTAQVWTTSNQTNSIIQHISVGGQPNPTSGIGGGIIFNLPHAENEVARLGVLVRPISGLAPVKFTVSLRLTADGRIQAVSDLAPRRAFYSSDVDPYTGELKTGTQNRPMPLYVEALGVRAWGKASDHPSTVFSIPGQDPSSQTAMTSVQYESALQSDFVQWGTDCSKDLAATAEVTTYNGVQSKLSTTRPVRLAGCDNLDFRPAIDVSTTETRPGVPTGATVRLSLGQNPAGQVQTALLKDAKVTLPKGLELGAQVASGADGLKLCSAAQFGVGADAASDCPAGSRAGTVTIATPLLDAPFSGRVYLGEQKSVGQLPALYLEASVNGSTEAEAPRIKLVGTVTANDDGTITTEFNDAPQLRFSELQIQFPGGAHALFVTPQKCGPTSATSRFTASTGKVVSDDSSIDITTCDPAPFAPTIAMTPADATAGASSATAVTVTRPDRSPWLSGVKVALPTGFLADLNAASECSKAAAAANTCPETSRIATVTTSAGAGDQPLVLGGAMYLVERDEGAVAGAAIVVRAKLGDLDLGDVVVPARIDLRPTDAGLVLTTTAPTRFRNLALLLRQITVTLDRSGFPLNPTACGPLRTTASLTADTGEAATATADTTYTGCAARPFAPQIKAELTGTIKSGQFPGVRVQLATRKGDSNLKATTVTLPVGVSAALENVKNQCGNAEFFAGNCPASTKVGTAKATVAITSDQLVGDVYLVRVEGLKLPGIGMSFGGRYTQRILSKVKVDGNGRLQTVFDAIPDLPLTTLDLAIDGGPKSPLILSPLVCESSTSWDAVFEGQGGQTSKVSLPYDCSTTNSELLSTTAASWSRSAGARLTFSAPKGKTLKTVKLTLPTGFKIKKSKASLKKNLRVTAKGGKVSVRVTSRGITITAKGTPAPTSIRVTLKPAGFTAKSKLSKGKRLSLRTSVLLSDASTASVKKVSVKVK